MTYLLDNEATKTMCNKDNRPVPVRVPSELETREQGSRNVTDARGRRVLVYVAAVSERQDSCPWLHTREQVCRPNHVGTACCARPCFGVAAVQAVDENKTGKCWR